MDDPEEEERIRKLNVIQDFNNKKANAHATIFVASMFALYTVLSLATKIAHRVSQDWSFWNFSIIGLSIVSYWIIWSFGLYSIGNFTYYSIVASIAELDIVKPVEHDLISKYIKERKGFFKCFASFKINENQGSIRTWLRNHNEGMSIIIYFLIGVLPFIAFIIWAFFLPFIT